MKVNLFPFQQGRSSCDNKDLLIRPATALLSYHHRTHTSDQIFNISFLSKRKETYGYTTRLQNNNKKAYRNIRSASLYETLAPHPSKDNSVRLQIINNACLKKVFFCISKPSRKNSTIYDVNASLSEHMHQPKKENQLPKYHCKKLRVVKGKPKIRIHSDANNQQQWSKGTNVSIVGTKLL